MIQLQDKIDNEQEPSELGPIAQTFFKTVISISCFISIPLALYVVWLFICIILHKPSWGGIEYANYH